MIWIVIAVIIFLFYAKTIGMAWFVIIIILFGVMTYNVSSFLDDINKK